MSGPRILIIEARFYADISDHLLKGATAALNAVSAHVQCVTVPGIYELPAALAFALEAAERAPGTWAAHGYVMLGCAIRGETDHYDHICREAMRGVQDIATMRLVALGNGILTVHDRQQALARCRPDGSDHGGQAARACLRMIALKGDLGIAEA
jgi:6,7-dimethyl-8-ribityllumazine synthase